MNEQRKSLRAARCFTELLVDLVASLLLLLPTGLMEPKCQQESRQSFPGSFYADKWPSDVDTRCLSRPGDRPSKSKSKCQNKTKSECRQDRQSAESRLLLVGGKCFWLSCQKKNPANGRLRHLYLSINTSGNKKPCSMSTDKTVTSLRTQTCEKNYEKKLNNSAMNQPE